MSLYKLPYIQPSVLEPSWFVRPTCVVAADLIGKVLCRQLTDSEGKQKNPTDAHLRN